MLEKPLVLNGHGSVDQILRNVLIGYPDPVDVGINLLHLLDVVLGVYKINKRAPVQGKILYVEPSVWNHILLEVIAHETGKNSAGDAHHRQGNEASTQSHLDRSPDYTPNSAQNPQAQRELVVLLFLLPKEFLLFHETASLSHPASARGPLTVYSIPISGKHKFSRNIIPYPASKRKREIPRRPAYFKKFPHFFQKIQSLFKSIPGKGQAPPL